MQSFNEQGKLSSNYLKERLFDYTLLFWGINSFDEGILAR
jgi:hypothetical protein